MTPKVSIIMGSTSDLPVMEKAMKWLNDQQIPFEVNALSAHRTPDAVEEFAKNAKQRGVMVIIAGAGMAAALPGVARHRCSYKGWYSRRTRCRILYHADASGHPCGNGGSERCTECGYSRCTDDSAGRQRGGRENRAMEEGSWREDRESQPRPCRHQRV